MGIRLSIHIATFSRICHGSQYLTCIAGGVLQRSESPEYSLNVHLFVTQMQGGPTTVQSVLTRKFCFV